MSWKILNADCIEAMAAMDAASVDAVVCDPPYGLEFMGKEWDRLVAPARGRTAGTEHEPTLESRDDSPHHRAAVRQPSMLLRCQSCGGNSSGAWGRCTCDEPEFRRNLSPTRAMQAWHEAWATEALRVLKPGGHLLAFGGTRTYHRLTCAIEDAGFEIRDSIAHLHTVRTEGILEAWLRWSESASNVGVRFVGAGDDSVPGPVLLATSLERSPASALIAELRLSEAHRIDAASWRSALERVAGITTESSALVTIAGNQPASHDATSSPGSTAPGGALDWLDASTEARTRAVEALRIWLGSGPSSRPAATAALCAALTDALKAITCAQSETFRSYDTTLRTVCASATTATTTASTAASLLAFTADTLATQDRGGDAAEASLGPLAWVYGSGFPLSKSLDVSKAIDKAAGAEREVVGRRTDGRYAYEFNGTANRPTGGAAGTDDAERIGGFVSDKAAITAPATPDAERWGGWGTALKPAHEPIVVARKPLAGTVAQNVLMHGTGALNVDGCRVDGAPELRGRDVPGNLPNGNGTTHGAMSRTPYAVPSGRWPANVVLDEEAAALLDEQAGELTSNSGTPFTRNADADGRASFGEFKGDEAAGFYGDTGGASRFFYCAKTSSAERNAGLDGFEAVHRVNGNKWTDQDYRVTRGERPPSAESGPRKNVHPTVKPIALMQWLVRLVTPPDGVVLDPFTGSGTTGIAAVREGFNFIGIEREAEYAAIAEARIRWWAAQPPDLDLDRLLAGDKARTKTADLGQASIFDGMEAA